MGTKGLGNCWSVAIDALPSEGKKRFTAWIQTVDKDIHWILRENLKKNRLARMDLSWVKEMNALIFTPLFPGKI